jgi:CRP/FNR family transcriptional regulator, cyclic AMP receptor protein
MILDERVRVLALVPEFRDMGAGDRAVLAAAMHEESFAAGETVVDAGDLGDRVFVVAAGRLEVTQPPRVGVVRTLERGVLLGELSFFAGAVRTATVRAAADSLLLSLPFADFRGFLLAHPESTLVLAGRVVRALLALEAEIAGEPRR